jgi:hypothetical protein
LGAEASVTRTAALSPVILWSGILAGPVAWAFDLFLSYSLTQWSCARERVAMLHVMTLGALVVIACGLVLVQRALRGVPEGASLDGGRSVDRARFMAMLGLASCALFGVTVIAGALPPWILTTNGCW